MGSCQDVGRVMTSYLDGEADAAARQAVDAHLRVCQPCARRAEAEKTVRRVVMVKAASLSVTAPDALRQRCAALAPRSKRQRRWVLLGWRALSLATASLVVLGLAGTLLYAVVTHSPTVLAAELALDHVEVLRAVRAARRGGRRRRGVEAARSRLRVAAGRAGEFAGRSPDPHRRPPVPVHRRPRRARALPAQRQAGLPVHDAGHLSPGDAHLGGRPGRARLDPRRHHVRHGRQRERARPPTGGRLLPVRPPLT